MTLLFVIVEPKRKKAFAGLPFGKGTYPMNNGLARVRHRSIIEVEQDDDLLQELVLDEIEIQSKKYKPSTDKNDGEWLPLADNVQTPENSHAYEEYRRLKNLRSYACVLLADDRDEARDTALDRLTRTAAKAMQCFASWICLMDLRRVIYLSSYGLNDIKFISRNFRDPCPHVMNYNADSVLVITDLADSEFTDKLSFLPPHTKARFYAAAPLISPEGHRIGTFGVTDNQPRPQGISAQEKQAMNDLAGLAIEILANRRWKADMKSKLNRTITCTSKDLNSPLHGLQMSLSRLKQDAAMENSNLSETQKDFLETAESCFAAMTKITMDAFAEINAHVAMETPRFTCPESTSTGPYECCVRELFDHAYETINDMQKHVPLVTCIDSTIPERIICDGVRVFQIAVSILSMAVSRATQGVVLLRVTQNASGCLVFSVSNPSVAPNHRQCVWQASSPLVKTVQKLVKMVHGTFGFCDSPQTAQKDDAILWFTMPVKLPPAATAALAKPPPTTVSVQSGK